MTTERSNHKKFILVTTNTPEKSGLLMVRNTVLECLDAVGLPYLIVHGGMSAQLLEFYCSQAAGLILPGGPDFAAPLYGEEPYPTNDKPDAQRDAVELQLLAVAAEQNWPVLAFCRGLQALWIHAGGRLIQHLPEITTQAHGRSGATYSDLYQESAVQLVRIERGNPLLEYILSTYLPGEYSSQETVQVAIRSMHHQAANEETLQELPLVVIGRAEDGTVEVVIHPAMKFWLAFQGHLEAEIAVTDSPAQRLLFAVLAAFKEAVAVAV